MATPTLRALRNHFRDAKILGVMRPYVQDVLAGTNWLDESILFDHRSSDRRLRSRSLVIQLRRHHVDSAILLTNSMRPALISTLSGIPQRVGYVRYARGVFLTEKLRPPRDGRQLKPVSAVDYYLEIAKSVGAASHDRQVALASRLEDEQQADQICESLGIANPDQMVTLNTGGAYGDAKSWPITHFADLAHRIVQDHNTDVMVVCGPAERESAAQIEKLANHPRIHSLAQQQLGIGLTKAMIRRSQLLVTTDSGPRHFGAAFGVTTITIFGPTDPRWSHNYNPFGTDLQLDLACRPCAKRSCPLKHHACMQELTPDSVYEAVRRHLKRDRRTAA